MIIDWQAVQARLAVLGHDPGPIDGLRGPRTDAAIVAFKRAVGLRARPYLGPITLAALFPPVTSAKLPWMAEAMRVRGLHERRDTAALRRWFGKGLAWLDPREVPWCGAFVETCLRQHGIGDLPENPLGARNWQGFGLGVPPSFGAVLVFWRGSRRGWKGHVGFYVGEDATHYHVLGGNQSNAVTITRIAKTRLLAARWPGDIPHEAAPILLTANGVPVTHNEE